MTAIRSKVEAIIANNAVAVFSKSYCPYCTATKKLLDGLGAQYSLLELDQIDDGAAIQALLGEMTKQTSVPNIFIAQKHVGGNSDLQARSKTLAADLKAAGAL